MREERLLERLTAMERDPSRRGRMDQGRLVESILAHLRCLLNTRQGCVPIAPDYGVPDFLDFLQRFPESIRTIEGSIRRTIELYEPRLEAVQVTFLPQEGNLLSLRFQINARLRQDNGSRVRFESAVETGGRVSVSC